jgi:hypothetical protein
MAEQLIENEEDSCFPYYRNQIFYDNKKTALNQPEKIG